MGHIDLLFHVLNMEFSLAQYLNAIFFDTIRLSTRAIPLSKTKSSFDILTIGLIGLDNMVDLAKDGAQIAKGNRRTFVNLSPVTDFLKATQIFYDKAKIEHKEIEQMHLRTLEVSDPYSSELPGALKEEGVKMGLVESKGQDVRFDLVVCVFFQGGDKRELQRMAQTVSRLLKPSGVWLGFALDAATLRLRWESLGKPKQVPSGAGAQIHMESEHKVRWVVDDGYHHDAIPGYSDALLQTTDMNELVLAAREYGLRPLERGFDKAGSIARWRKRDADDKSDRLALFGHIDPRMCESLDLWSTFALQSSSE